MGYFSRCRHFLCYTVEKSRAIQRLAYFMWWQSWKTRISIALSLKCGAILLLFLFSVLVVACGSGTNTQLGDPSVTVTIVLNGNNGSPTPPIPDYTCSAWATNTSPGINVSIVGVYAKFVHIVDGNPQGIGGAIGNATVTWPDGTSTLLSATTTADGLAVYAIPINGHSSDINQIVRVALTFTKAGVPTCTVSPDRAAFFTLTIATATASATASPSATATAVPTGTTTPGITPTPTATVPPTPTATPCVTPGPDPSKKTPTPTPTPCH